MKYWFIFCKTDLLLEKKKMEPYTIPCSEESNPNKALDSHSQYYPDGRRNRGEDLHHS